MLHEWRAALRSIARRRGLAVAVVLTLALGIGANSAIFSAIDTVLLKPLPYPAADRLLAVFETNTGRKQHTALVAPPRLEEWNRLNRTFDGIAGSYFENLTDTSGPLPERVAASRTSPRFFSVLGTPPALGRTPTPQEEVFGGPGAVVLSDAFWRNRLGADASAVGRTLTLGGAPRTVIGVMPASFRYPSATTDAWIPAQMPAQLLSQREARFYLAVGRMKPGVTSEEARADVAVVQARLAEQFPQTDGGWSTSVEPLKEQQVGGVRRSLWLLFGSVLLVLLAACGNVACLLLADAAHREHEIAVRFALGAARARVVRQLLLEGLVLALAGSAAGLLLARWGIAALRSAAIQLPRAHELAVDGRLVAFTLALASVTTVIFALAPALQATRREVAERLAHGGRGQVSGRHILQRALVAGQVTLAMMLLVGAGLLVRSFAHLQQVPPGFDPQGVLAFRVSAAWSERAEAVSARQLRTLERLRAIPGVAAAALTQWLPAVADYPPNEFKVVGRETGERYFAVARQVSADYFATLGIPFLQGETCRDDPNLKAPRTVVVSRALTERYFPGENPIGHHIALRYEAEIVGVVADVHERGLMKEPEPTAYFCGLMPYWPDPYHIVRSDRSRPVAMGAVREALREIEPQRPVYSAAPLAETIAESLAQPRLNTVLLALFALTALLLAAVGLYGMLAHFVSQRRREIGVRMALGARPAQVLAQVARHGATITGIGTAVGFAAALALARVMDTLVYGIPALDPVTFAVVPMVLGIIAAAATILPARRAARMAPMQALREE